VKPYKTVFHRAEQFVEKPHFEKALEYLNSGQYRWNSGMFLWSFVTITEGVIRLTGLDKESETSEEHDMSEEPGKRTFAEEIEVEGRQLVERVRDLIHEGNIRRIRIKDSKGRYLLEVPMTVGVWPAVCLPSRTVL
jgi:hypothetical protein